MDGRRIDVEGDAVVPNFNLSIGGKAVALETHYIAVVDGTNGTPISKLWMLVSCILRLRSRERLSIRRDHHGEE